MCPLSEITKMSNEVNPDHKRKLPNNCAYQMNPQQLIVSGMLEVMEYSPTKEEYLDKLSTLKLDVCPDGNCIVGMWAFGKLLDDLLYKTKEVRLDIVELLYIDCNFFRSKVQEINKAPAPDAVAGDEFLADPKNFCNHIVQKILHCKNYKTCGRDWTGPPDSDAINKWNDLKRVFLLIVEDLHVHMDLDIHKLSSLGNVEWPLIEAVTHYISCRLDMHEPTTWMPDMLYINSIVSRSKQCVPYVGPRYDDMPIDREKEHFSDILYPELLKKLIMDKQGWAVGRLVYLQGPSAAFNNHFYKMQSSILPYVTTNSSIFLGMMAKVVCLKVDEDEEDAFQDQIYTFIDSKIDEYALSCAKYMASVSDMFAPSQSSHYLHAKQNASSKFLLAMLRLCPHSLWKQRPFKKSALFKIAIVDITAPGEMLYESHKKILYFILERSGKMQLRNSETHWMGYDVLSSLVEDVTKITLNSRPSKIESINTIISWIGFQMKSGKTGFVNGLTGSLYNETTLSVEKSVLEKACNYGMHSVVREILNLFKSTATPLFYEKTDYDSCMTAEESSLSAVKMKHNSDTMFSVSQYIMKKTASKHANASSWKFIWNHWIEFEEVKKCFLFNDV